jgi:hypothetical protein
MGDIKQAFANTANFTITLHELASSATAGRGSTAIDNSSNLYLDALVTLTVKTANAAMANDKAVYLYAYGSEDGTNYEDAFGGSDAAHTPLNLKLIGVLDCQTQNVTYRGVFSVAQAFGGILPRKWGIVVRNYTGQALAADVNAASYSGVYATAS